MVARHQKQCKSVQGRSGNETYYRYPDTDPQRLVTRAIDCATGQLSGAATAEPYPNNNKELRSSTQVFTRLRSTLARFAIVSSHSGQYEAVARSTPMTR